MRLVIIKRTRQRVLFFPAAVLGLAGAKYIKKEHTSVMAAYSVIIKLSIIKARHLCRAFVFDCNRNG